MRAPANSASIGTTVARPACRRCFPTGYPRTRPNARVEQAVDARLAAALKDTEASLPARFGEVTLGMLSRDFDAKAARLRQPR